MLKDALHRAKKNKTKRTQKSKQNKQNIVVKRKLEKLCGMSHVVEGREGKGAGVSR